MARRRRTGTTWQPSESLAAERRVSAVNLGTTVPENEDAISGWLGGARQFRSGVQVQRV